jgi:hypothetical protein
VRVRVPKTLTKDKLLKFVYKVALLPRERGQVDSALNELIDEAEILFDFDPLWRVRRIKSRENPAIYEFTPTWDDAQWLAAEVNRNGYTRDGHFVAGKFRAESLGGVCPVVFGEVAKKDGGNK